MNRIRLLPEQVANQIAAGEVVERPASVVKELVENALDAQAQRVAVEVQAGGRSLIRVTDDGVGMNRDDALLCLERHATSKIRSAQDLSAIATMGFRGEALPSIASVCRMTLTTQERGSDQPATQILISGGKITDVGTAGSPPGTSVEVRQLFFNLPARRKFLRTAETEYTHIHHYLTLAALACPDVAFTFVRDGKRVWQLPPVPLGEGQAGRLAALRERLRVVSGLEAQLLPVDFSMRLQQPGGTGGWDRGSSWELRNEGEPADKVQDEGEEKEKETGTDWVRLWGWIGRPGVARSTRQDQHLFVNQRPVESRGLSMALLEGYHTALMKGRFPVCCLFLEIDPGQVDVNIHPAKREVKFRNERAIRHLTTQAVRQTLLAFHEPPATPSQPGSVSIPVPQSEREMDGTPPPARVVELPGFPPRKVAPAEPVTAPVATSIPAPQPAVDKPAGQEIIGSPESSETSPGQARAEEMPGGGPPPGVEPKGESEPAALLQIPLRLVGVLGRLYVVLESDRGLVLMDQHAAHERILFEKMLAQLEKGQAPSQRLLLAETVELPVRDAHFVKTHLETLNRLGVGLSEFGEHTFLLDALPPFVKASEPRQFILELVDELKAAGQAVNTMRLGEQTIAKTVCRHSVKANDPLREPELQNLIQDLRQCAMPYTCPHGRPTLIEMNFRELEKKFGRVV